MPGKYYTHIGILKIFLLNFTLHTILKSTQHDMTSDSSFVDLNMDILFIQLKNIREEINSIVMDFK